MIVFLLSRIALYKYVMLCYVSDNQPAGSFLILPQINGACLSIKQPKSCTY